MVTTRAVCREDAEAVARLSEVLAHSVSVEECRARLERLESSPDRAGFVAERDTHVLGWVEVVRFESLTAPPSGLLLGLVVDPEKHGSGLGRLLVDEAEAWARARGLSALRVRSRQHRTEAHAFYRHLGFEKAKEQSLFIREVSSSE